jgi:hypothetical protein
VAQLDHISRAVLTRELRAIARDHRLTGRSEKDLFVLWFLMVYATNDNVTRAMESLTGFKGDAGVDAVFIDTDKHIAYVVQGKLRDSVMERTERKDVVNEFAGYARVFWGKRNELRDFCNAEHVDDLTADKLERVRGRLTSDRRYVLRLCFVTLGKFSKGVRVGAQIRVSATATDTQLLLIDGDDVMHLLGNYLDGVVHVPPLDLRIAPGAAMSAGMLKRVESRLESRVLTMSADDVAGLLRVAGNGLFARNIRGPLGYNEVNRDIEASLKKHPELFWFKNNGLTILCDDIEPVQDTRLRLTNAQIINGQQTTYTLFEIAKDSVWRPALRRANVVVRVIRVPRDGPEGQTFDEFVSSVVQATNWQNKIQASDLRSNDERQISLQRQLRAFGYEYVRKREKKTTARAAAGNLATHTITKFELAQAVAGCEIDSLPLRVGKEPLFQERENWYSRIFPKNKGPYFFLTRYCLAVAVAKALQGKGELRTLRWPVVHFLWQEIGGVLEGNAERFHDRYWDAESRLSRVLAQLVRIGVAASARFYRANRRESGKVVAIDDFWKRESMNYKGRSVSPSHAFRAYWASTRNRLEQRRFEQLRDRLVSELRAKAA